MVTDGNHCKGTRLCIYMIVDVDFGSRPQLGTISGHLITSGIATSLYDLGDMTSI